MKILLLFTFFGLVSAGSALAGHLEGTDHLTLEKARESRTFLVPEYMPTWSVIISDLMLWPAGTPYPRKEMYFMPPRGMNNIKLAEAINQAGASLLIITSSEAKSKLEAMVKSHKLKNVQYLRIDKYLDKERVDAVFRSLMIYIARELGLNPHKVTAAQVKQLQTQAQRYLIESRTIGHNFVRDFSPMFGMNSAGQYRLVDHNFDVHRPVSDQVPSCFAKALKYERLSVPLYNAGGNITCNQKECFMASFVSEQNSPKEIENKKACYPTGRAYNEKEIKELYESIMFQKFTILDRLPYELTGHIDIWLKHVSDDTLLIAELETRSIESDPRIASQPKLHEALKEIQSFLTQKKIDFEALGYRAIPVPMMLPLLPDNGKKPVTDTEEIHSNPELAAYFYSYVNSALISTRNGKKTALVPRFRTINVDSPLEPSAPEHYDQKLIGSPDVEGSYEFKVTQAYKSAGYDIIWVDSDFITSAFGSVHCVTMQVPYPFKPEITTPDK